MSKRGQGSGSRFSHVQRERRRRVLPAGEEAPGCPVKSLTTVIRMYTDGALSAFVNILLAV